MLTPAEAAALKAQVNSYIDLYTSNPPPPPPSSLERFRDYDGAWFGDHLFYATSCNADGIPTPNEKPTPIYRSHVVDARNALAFWGDSEERRGLRVGADGNEWHVGIGFADASTGNLSSGMFWALECIKADWVNYQTGALTDLSHLLPPGPNGAPYFPDILPTSGRYRMRSWNMIWLSEQQGGGRGRPCYLETEFIVGQVVTNPCWLGDDKIHDAIIFREAWWDGVSGWVRGYPQEGGAAWSSNDPNALPLDAGTMVFRGWQAFGKRAGLAWVYRYNDFKEGLSGIDLIVPKTIALPMPYRASPRAKFLKALTSSLAAPSLKRTP